MKKNLLPFLLLTTLLTHAQVKDASQNLKQQAEKMGAAFVNSNYAAVTSYTYPAIVHIMGGPAQMTATITKMLNDMKAQGMTFTKITIDEPSKIVKSGNELQATVPQHTNIKLTQGRVVSTSTLIAISADNGVHWTFVDTSNKDLATLKKTLPNLSPALTIRPAQQPVRYND